MHQLHRRNILPQIMLLLNEQLGRLEIYDGNGWVGITTTNDVTLDKLSIIASARPVGAL